MNLRVTEIKKAVTLPKDERGLVINITAAKVAECIEPMLRQMHMVLDKEELKLNSTLIAIDPATGELRVNLFVKEEKI